MKMLKILFASPLLALFIMACNDDTSEQDKHHKEDMKMEGGAHEGHKINQDGSVKNMDRTGPEYTSEYVCQMHCDGSGSDEPGKCPVCGMDYVKNDN